MKPITVTFKQSEKWLYDYIAEHSSPPAYLKDLAMMDYKRNNTYSEAPKKEIKNVPNFDFLD